MHAEPVAVSETQQRARSARNFEDNPRRRHIIDAAADCFAELGFHGATIEVIASRAQVSRPSVYAYFSSRDEVFRGVTDHVCERFLQAQHVEGKRTAAEHPGSEDLRHVLTITTSAFIEAVYEFGGLLAVIEQRALLDPDVAEKWAAVRSRLIKRYARFVEQLARAHDIQLCAPATAIAELLSDAQLVGARRLAADSKRKRAQYISSMVTMSEQLIGLPQATKDAHV
ncbi:putative TetR family transcriptional regulator [Gordonia effusa NBRC 100432]|uniref:Putative TetR family transcriptional regulator n=1 Tax=Gordonia effusa NBRC 100432 TaxID=1077974 RepID=H0R532_9ACTN|nr:putative TetR family transcriptional regulator [Gordonia effusa NBRC 100432]